MRFVLGIILLACPAFAQQTLPTQISKVVVFSDRAEITRSGQIASIAGDAELIIKNLPPSLLNESVRIGGSGTADSRITDIRVETEYIDTLPKNRLKELEDDLENLLSEERVHNDRLNLLRKEKDLLDQIKQNIISQKPDSDQPRPSMEDWTKLFLFYDTNFEKLNSEIRTTEKKKDDLSDRKNNLKRQISQLSGYGKLAKKSVIVKVTAGRSGTTRLDLSYVITGARWYPSYDVRVSPDDKTVEFVYNAVVSQKTGEDWKQVDLSISTARPQVSGNVPTLSAWYLSVEQPITLRSARSAKKSSDMDLLSGLAGSGGGAGMGMAEEEEAFVPEAPVTYDEAGIETNTTAVVFTVRQKSDIPADGFEHRVLLAAQPLKADFAYTGVPKISEFAYLQGSIENTTDVPFLAGNANVFFGSNYVGTTSLRTIIPTETFTTSLGVDEGIRIKREQIRDYQAEKGFLSKSKKKTFEFKITVQSFKKNDEEIVIRDQFPVSRDERIKVELVTPEFDKDKAVQVFNSGNVEKRSNGMLEWKFKIKPQEKVEIRLKYTVEYPRELLIEGL